MLHLLHYSLFFIRGKIKKMIFFYFEVKKKKKKEKKRGIYKREGGFSVTV